ncbi:MAG: hypothetical protein M5U34_07865 [Chloroflexi bacterium]|jgi:hypothetical protein|nr:hypothetical protein [Chloroflexota bacterium]
MTTIDLSELKNISLEEVLYRVARQREPLTIRLSTKETVTLKPGLESEDAYWQQLVSLGLISEQHTPTTNELTYEPIYSSDSVSEIILRERR